MPGRCFLASALILVALHLMFIPPSVAQSTSSITYQGRLDDGAMPVDGSVDLVFTFFDKIIDGQQLAASFSVNDVRVEQGYFTQDIPVPNLPNAFFLGDVWLEIKIAHPAGSGQFETLSPRQAVRPAPRALLAQNALRAESVDEGALFWRQDPFNPDGIFFQSGPVAIGTAAGSSPLTVFADSSDGASSAIWAGYAAPSAIGVDTVIRADAQVSLGDARAIWATTASDDGYAGYFEGGRNYFEGWIGVGTATPGASIDVLSDRGGLHTGVRVTNSPGGGRGFVADLGGPSSGTNGLGFLAEVGPFSTGFRAQTGNGSNGFVAEVGAGSTGFLAEVADGVGLSAVANGTGSVGVVVNANGTDSVGVQSRVNSPTGSTIGVSGFSNSASGVGVRGENSFNGIGVHAISPGGQALLADGNVTVNGTLVKSAGSFRIDHPLSPQTHYLSHSFVESPDMMNIYNGNVVTDRAGYAEVVLPDWFDALNRDFRYQLTVIASFAQAAIWEELRDNRFVIRTTEPDTKVSWQ